jgi:hypothetical protein
MRSWRSARPSGRESEDAAVQDAAEEVEPCVTAVEPVAELVEVGLQVRAELRHRLEAGGVLLLADVREARYHHPTKYY